MDESKKPGSLEEDYEPTDEEVAAAERIIDKHRRWAEKKLSSIGNNETTSVLDDPSYRERILEHAHHIAGIYRDGLDSLEQGNQHLKAVLAKGVHESVQRAADNVIGEILGGQVKSGQLWTGQIRPVAPGRVRVARDRSVLQVSS